MRHRMIAIFLAILCWSLPLGAANTDESKAAQTALHILDYISVDYPDVVQDGRILNKDEYREQKEFAGQLDRILSALPPGDAKQGLRQRAENLATAIDTRAPGRDIVAIAKELSTTLIGAYDVKIAPEVVPPLHTGARLYAENCASCHGIDGHGDGPAAAGLEPAPANFHDRARQSQRSIYGLYSTISLGVTGTAMSSYAQLSENERWALAFYVGNFFAEDADRDHGAALWQEGRFDDIFPDLAALTGVTPAAIEASHGADGVAALTYLRAFPNVLDSATPLAALGLAQSKLGESLDAYRAGRQQEAYDAALTAYLQGFELVESSLRVTGPELRETIEHRMTAYRAGIKQGLDMAEIKRQAEEIEHLLGEASGLLGNGTLSGTAGAIGAFLLVLREGLEAILVLAAILAFLTKTDRRQQTRYVHAGWIGALALGALTWYIASRFISISGAHREITEGITALVAAAMLIYVGYWLHSNSHATRWKSFLHEKLSDTKMGRSIGTLVAISFLAVYREVFETILFFQTLWLQVAEAEQGYLIGGLVSAALLLVLLAWAVFRFSVRLPVQLFFRVNAVLLFSLAVIFTGKGIAGLQEAGVLSYSPVSAPEIELLGVHATLEGLVAQGLLVAIGLGWAIYRRYRPPVAQPLKPANEEA